MFLSATAQAASGLISPAKDTIYEMSFTGDELFDDTLRWINTSADTQTIDSLVPIVKTADANRCQVSLRFMQAGLPSYGGGGGASSTEASRQNDTLSFNSGFDELLSLAPGDTLNMFLFMFDWCTGCLEWPQYYNWQEGDEVTAPIVFYSSAGSDTLTIKAYWGGFGWRFASHVATGGGRRLESAPGSHRPTNRQVFDASGRKTAPGVPARNLQLRHSQERGRSVKSLSVGGSK